MTILELRNEEGSSHEVGVHFKRSIVAAGDLMFLKGHQEYPKS